MTPLNALFISRKPHVSTAVPVGITWVYLEKATKRREQGVHVRDYAMNTSLSLPRGNNGDLRCSTLAQNTRTDEEPDTDHHV